MKKFFNILLIFILSGCINLINVNNDDIYEIQPLLYTGPYLDQEYITIENIENNSQGTGHAFEVTLKYSYDGDTAHFYLPSGYETYYPSTSFRFFNIDTKEIGNNLEEWGKTASIYTRECLTNAHSILLQNDPNNSLLDYYDRGLAWIWIQEKEDSPYELLNYKIIQQGLGEVKYLYGAGETLYYNEICYTDYMYQAQDEAKENNRGLFGLLKDPNWIY